MDVYRIFQNKKISNMKVIKMLKKSEIIEKLKLFLTYSGKLKKI